MGKFNKRKTQRRNRRGGASTNNNKETSSSIPEYEDYMDTKYKILGEWPEELILKCKKYNMEPAMKLTIRYTDLWNDFLDLLNACPKKASEDLNFEDLKNEIEEKEDELMRSKGAAIEAVADAEDIYLHGKGGSRKNKKNLRRRRTQKVQKRKTQKGKKRRR